jgi:hypothetical protein
MEGLDQRCSRGSYRFAEGVGFAERDDEITALGGRLAGGRTGAVSLAVGFEAVGMGSAVGRSANTTVGGVDESGTTMTEDQAVDD